jgi:hypothetical protein
MNHCGRGRQCAEKIIIMFCDFECTIVLECPACMSTWHMSFWSGAKSQVQLLQCQYNIPAQTLMVIPSLKTMFSANYMGCASYEACQSVQICANKQQRSRTA